MKHGARRWSQLLTVQPGQAQLSSNLLVMQTTVRQTASRLAIQSALQRYYAGNLSDSNWARTRDDFTAVFAGDGEARLAIQARVYAKNTSDLTLLSITADTLQGLQLPFTKPDGENATLGDDEYGFVPELYPKFTTVPTTINATYNQTFATFDGRPINRDSYLLSGPYQVNSTLSLISITMPIINNTSSIDTLGWLTTVLDAGLITRVVNSMEGLDNSGLTMIFGPDNATNSFPTGVLYDTRSEESDPTEEKVCREICMLHALSLALSFWGVADMYPGSLRAPSDKPNHCEQAQPLWDAGQP